MTIEHEPVKAVLPPGVASAIAEAAESLNEEERNALFRITQAWTAIFQVVKLGGNPNNIKNDLRELAQPVHVLQQAIMSNAAARTNPGQFRPLGGTLYSFAAQCPAKRLGSPGLDRCQQAEGHDGEHAYQKFPAEVPDQGGNT